MAKSRGALPNPVLSMDQDKPDSHVSAQRPTQNTAERRANWGSGCKTQESYKWRGQEGGSLTSQLLNLSLLPLKNLYDPFKELK